MKKIRLLPMLTPVGVNKALPFAHHAAKQERKLVFRTIAPTDAFTATTIVNERDSLTDVADSFLCYDALFKVGVFDEPLVTPPPTIGTIYPTVMPQTNTPWERPATFTWYGVECSADYGDRVVNFYMSGGLYNHRVYYYTGTRAATYPLTPVAGVGHYTWNTPDPVSYPHTSQMVAAQQSAVTNYANNYTTPYNNAVAARTQREKDYNISEQERLKDVIFANDNGQFLISDVFKTGSFLTPVTLGDDENQDAPIYDIELAYGPIQRLRLFFTDAQTSVPFPGTFNGTIVEIRYRVSAGVATPEKDLSEFAVLKEQANNITGFNFAAGERKLYTPTAHGHVYKKQGYASSLKTQSLYITKTNEEAFLGAMLGANKVEFGFGILPEGLVYLGVDIQRAYLDAAVAVYDLEGVWTIPVTHAHKQLVYSHFETERSVAAGQWTYTYLTDTNINIMWNGITANVDGPQVLSGLVMEALYAQPIYFQYFPTYINASFTPGNHFLQNDVTFSAAPPTQYEYHKDYYNQWIDVHPDGLPGICQTGTVTSTFSGYWSLSTYASVRAHDLAQTTIANTSGSAVGTVAYSTQNEAHEPVAGLNFEVAPPFEYMTLGMPSAPSSNIASLMVEEVFPDVDFVFEVDVVSVTVYTNGTMDVVTDVTWSGGSATVTGHTTVEIKQNVVDAIKNDAANAYRAAYDELFMDVYTNGMANPGGGGGGGGGGEEG